MHLKQHTVMTKTRLTVHSDQQMCTQNMTQTCRLHIACSKK